MPRKIDSKSEADIVSEWDALAHVRFQQITSGEDITFKHVLAPKILELVSREPANTIIDAGCGVGILTGLLAKVGGTVVGVDPSAQSIGIARSNFGAIASFYQSTLEAYAGEHQGQADLVVANMVMMNVLDLAKFVTAAWRILRPNGAFIFSITHPCFWPTYYGYEQEPWFRYDQEIIVESPFRITAHPDCSLPSTHVHRPVEAYIRTFFEAKFLIETLKEPMPSPDVDALYPRRWHFPRYIIGLCRR